MEREGCITLLDFSGAPTQFPEFCRDTQILASCRIIQAPNFFRGIDHICVPCQVFFHVLLRLDGDNVMKYLCCLIPRHTIKSLIFSRTCIYLVFELTNSYIYM